MFAQAPNSGTASAQATSKSEPGSAATRSSREVAAAAAAIVAAFGRHDAKAYFALFAPDATFVFHTTAQRLNSRAEYEAEWAKWEKEDAFRVRSCKSTDQRVQVFGDVAVFTHSVQTELSAKGGPAPCASAKPSSSSAAVANGLRCTSTCRRIRSPRRRPRSDA